MSLYINTYGIHFFSTKVLSSNPDHDEAYSIQHYVIKFVSDLVNDFSPGIPFSPPIKLTATI